MTSRWVTALIAMGIGCVLLATGLSSGSATAFFVSTILLALVWVVGAVVTAPLAAGRFPPRSGTRMRATALGAFTGAVLAAVFIVGALVVRRIPALHDAMATVTAHAQQGSTVLVVMVTLTNGIGEELFFRGALYELLDRDNPIVTTTAIYTLVTAATGNVMLALAAIPVGLSCALLRRATTGVLAPVAAHVVWSAIMFTALPPLL